MFGGETEASVRVAWFSAVFRCHRWFRRRGGLAVHRCVPKSNATREPIWRLAAQRGKRGRVMAVFQQDRTGHFYLFTLILLFIVVKYRGVARKL